VNGFDRNSTAPSLRACKSAFFRSPCAVMKMSIANPANVRRSGAPAVPNRQFRALRISTRSDKAVRGCLPEFRNASADEKPCDRQAYRFPACPVPAVRIESSSINNC